MKASEAERRYQEMCARVSQFQDKLGCEVDEGIFETVVMFNLLGFTTHQSCEGHLDHGVCHPWIDVTDKDWESLHLRRWLKVCELEEQAQAVGAPEAYDRWLEASVRLRLVMARYDQEGTLYQRLSNLLDTFYGDAPTPSPMRLAIRRFRSAGIYRIEPGFADVAETLPESLKATYLARGQAEMRAFTHYLKELWQQRQAEAALDEWA